MPQQTDLFARDLDLVTIQSRAQAEALRIRAAARRRGRGGAAKGGRADRVAGSYLAALRELLGEPKNRS
jgi:hypothetical protein